MLSLGLLLLTPPIFPDEPVPPVPPGCAPALSAQPPIPPPSRTFDPSVPYGDQLGDAWEMEETSCWRGIWTRRGNGKLWDGYWVHPRGERVRAVLEIENRGHSVTAVRRHANGDSCRYDGVISGDWWEITGTYRCTWEIQTVLPWRGQIIRLEHSEPQLLRRKNRPQTDIPPVRPLGQ